MVGGGWCDIKEFGRVEGGGDDTLEVGWLNTLYKLEGESLVLPSFSNWDLLELLLMAGNGGIIEVNNRYTLNSVAKFKYNVLRKKSKIENKPMFSFKVIILCKT